MDKIWEILQKTEDFLENGDGYNALLIVDAITEVWMEELGELEDIYGLDEEFMLTLDETWAEAFLTADLEESEYQEWQEKLEDHANVYSFAIALTALAEGWEHPPLLKVFAGEIPENGLWEDEDYPDFADNLAVIRLKILDRQQRYQDYLNLALAEGQTLLYLLMQVRVGAFDKALKEGLQWLGTAEDALALAKAFREQQYLDEALRLAEHGLSLEGYAKKELASWTAELAKGMDAPEKALNATILGFKAQPTLRDYLAIQQLANPQDWDYGGYSEFHSPPWRYRFVDIKAVLELTGMRSLEEFQQNHEALIRKALHQPFQRQERWTKALALGSQTFVESFAQQARLSPI